MIETAVALASAGFPIGWGPVSDAKAVNRRWKLDATIDPAMVPKLLRGARNPLVIPDGDTVVIDVDDPVAAAELIAILEPVHTFVVDSPTPGHCHYYGRLPASVDPKTLPTYYTGGEVRRASNGMVLGPWSVTTAGTYRPRNGVGPEMIGIIPKAAVDWLIASKRKVDRLQDAARGPEDDGWQVIHGRHPFLISRAARMRHLGIHDEILFDALRQLRDERCSAPGGTIKTDDELCRIVEWTDEHVDDDGEVIVVNGTTEPLTIGARTALDLRHGDPPPQLAEPFLTPEGPTLIYARGGTGKGLLACWFSQRLVRDGHVVMVVDFEGHEREWGSRLRGLGMTDDELAKVQYRAPFGSDWTAKTGALSVVAELLRDDVARLGVTYLIVDSYSVGTSNGDTMGGETAAREYFSALTKIGLPSLTIAHVRGDADKFADRPFGSVFVHNLARETWAVAVIGGEDDPTFDPDEVRFGPNVVALELRNKKANARPHAPPQFVTFSFFADGSIEATTDPPGGRSVADLAADVVADGPLTIAKIAAAIKEDTGRTIGEETLGRTLRRDRVRFIQSTNGRPRTWSLR